MSILRLYARVLGQLDAEKRLAFLLVLANLALAASQFAEPILFGRIIDALTQAQAAKKAITFTDLGPLLGGWIGFGLFSIVAAVTVALHADRLAHRRRLASWRAISSMCCICRCPSTPASIPAG
jgi:ABC-type multidrug transport system fused ATPase/permease subunit